MRFYLVIFFFLIGLLTANSQSFKLSEKSIKKVEQTKDPLQRLNKYRKFYSKDSIKFLKKNDRYWQHKLDSIHGLMRVGITKIENRKRNLARKIQDPVDKLSAGHLRAIENDYRFPSELESKYSKEQLTAIYATMRYYLSEMAKDTLHLLKDEFATYSLASVRNELEKKSGISVSSLNNPVNGLKAKGNKMFNNKMVNSQTVNDVKGLGAEARKHLDDYTKYSQYGDMSVDSAKQLALKRAESEVQGKLMSSGPFKDQQRQLTLLKDRKALEEQYKPQMTLLQDSAARKEMAKKKAEELASTYIENSPNVLKSAQRKMDVLMKKYSFVPNSNDLSTAVKRTSLKGKAFKERLVIATNFQLLSIDPVAIDFAPQVGFKFNTRFAAGIGAMYRQTFSDTMYVISPTVFGYKGFVSYDLIRSFFAYGEYAQNSPGILVSEGVAKRTWKPAAIVGVGRKFAVHKKVDMTITGLYNFLYKHPDPVYPRAFFVRVGFQLSDIAFLKKKPDLKW
ncbi:MAG: hypothetical protein DI538_16760 [Azospira oryzae]|nr:MAG: hypothetical protein DI538_16760 [Azospira oryzae]